MEEIKINPLDEIKTVKVAGNGYLLNGTMSVPMADGNREQVLTADQLGNIEIASNKWSLTTNLVPSGQTWYITTIYTTKRTSLESYPLENLDTIRDKILMTPGDMIFDISNESMSVAPFTNFAKRTTNNDLNTINTQYIS